MIGLTKSHQKVKNGKPACDRYRVICRLAEAVVTSADYKATLLAISSELGLHLDEQAKDAARWFIPCTTIVLDQLVTGQPFEVVHAQPAAELVRARSITAPVASGERGQLARSTLTFLSMYKVDASLGAPEGWHQSFIKAAMDMKEQNYSEDDAASLLATASPEGVLDETDFEQLADVFTNRGGALSFRPNWPVMLPARNGNPARPNPTAPANIAYMLKGALGHEFYTNERRQLVFYKDNFGVFRQLTDQLLSKYRTKAREHGLSPDAVVDTVMALALDNSFDPLLDVLNITKWDGVDRIEPLFNTINISGEPSKAERAWYLQFLKRWIVAAINKVYRPGSENNVLVLQGEQAAGKSRWLKRLTSIWPEGFGEGSINPENKDHELRHIDNFIWHVAEFDSTTNRREVGALKDFFTKDVINTRRPYARVAISANSICSFCASVNSHDFLQDLTGNRRYLVIPVESVEFMHDIDIIQLWAQARDLANSGFQYWYTRDEIKEINELNEKFMSKEDYLGEFEGRVSPGNELDKYMSLTDILRSMGSEFMEIQMTKAVRSNLRTIMAKKEIPFRTENGTVKFKVDAKLLKISADAESRKLKVAK
jgi:hypothetical protein